MQALGCAASPVRCHLNAGGSRGRSRSLERDRHRRALEHLACPAIGHAGFVSIAAGLRLVTHKRAPPSAVDSPAEEPPRMTSTTIKPSTRTRADEVTAEAIASFDRCPDPRLR